MTEAEAAAALPIAVLEFGFHQLEMEDRVTIAQAIVHRFDVLGSEMIKWEMSECDGSPSIRFNLNQAPWMLERHAFRPTIDAMYKQAVQLIQDMAEGDGSGTKFRCVSVEFADAPSVGENLKQIFDLER